MIVVPSPDYRVQFRSACAGHADRYHFFKGKAVSVRPMRLQILAFIRENETFEGHKRQDSFSLDPFFPTQGTDENARRENQIRGGHPLSVSCPREVQGRDGQAWL